ncbi:MAG: hypothetical protein WAV09_03310 [Minisyncoccia bacterium]
MAQSFGVPSRECSVAEFDAIREAGHAEAAWKGFCDCMFVETVEANDFLSGGTVIVQCINGSCQNVNNGQALPGVTPVQAAQMVTNYALQRNEQYSVKIYALPRATPDWKKCMSNFCAAPAGCPNPVEPSVLMPFNISPGAALSPWTDLGAAARMIPKRNAGFFYDVTALLTIDLAAYEPLKLWQTFWTNPFLFGILMTKIQLIPLAGAAYATALTFTGPPVFLIPGAIESCEKQGKDVVKEVFEVAGIGLIEQGKFAIKYLTKCGFGIPGACGVGLAVQKAAQDQIDSGEIHNVASKEGKAIIAFLASSGSELVDAAYVVIAEPIKGFSGVLSVFERGFRAIAQILPDADTKKVFELLATVFEVAAVIAKGIESRTDAAMIADNVADILLGFRPTEYFSMIAKGQKQSAVDSAQASMARTGNTVEGMIAKADAIVGMLDEVITSIDKLSQKLGGGLDALVRLFSGMRNDIGGATQAVVQVGNQIDSVTREVLGIPAGQPIPEAPVTTQISTQSGYLARFGPAAPAISPRPPPRVATTVTTIRPSLPLAIGPAVRPPVQAAPASGGAGAALLAGAGVGFLLGGPAGAVVGGIGAAIATKK